MNKNSGYLTLILALLTNGCGADSEEGESRTAPAPKGNFDSHLAALGTELLHCRGSLSRDDFYVDDRQILRRAFDACPSEPGALEEIDRLLAVQLYPPAHAAPHLAEAWQNWRDRDSERACPQWTLLDTTNAPDRNAALKATTLEVASETFNHWRVEGPKDCAGDAECATSRAVECAGWLGMRFVVSIDAGSSAVVTDPVWWKDNTNYNPNPFDPSWGWVHPMAGYGLPPGDLWGAVNRAGENCTRYNSDMITTSLRRLVPVDCDGFGWICMTECK